MAGRPAAWVPLEEWLPMVASGKTALPAAPAERAIPQQMAAWGSKESRELTGASEQPEFEASDREASTPQERQEVEEQQRIYPAPERVWAGG